jgi:hypothetical protein
MHLSWRGFLWARIFRSLVGTCWHEIALVHA